MRLGAFNGLQLAMLARDVRADVRVVVFSGFDDPVLKEEARRIGASYLVKPVSGHTIVQEHLRATASGRSDEPVRSRVRRAPCPSCRPTRPELLERHVALMLPQEVQEAFVVAGGMLNSSTSTR